MVMVQYEEKPNPLLDLFKSLFAGLTPAPYGRLPNRASRRAAERSERLLSKRIRRNTLRKIEQHAARDARHEAKRLKAALS